jgi:tight adherence protein B
MSDREIFAKFNSLMAGGLSLDQATRIADPTNLSDQFAKHYRLLMGVCQEAGGSPVLALRNLEKIAEQQQENEAKLRMAGTVPKATARLVLLLPLGSSLLGQLLGLGSISVFFESMPALVSLLIGLLLLMAAQAWSQRIMLSANRLQQGDQIVLDAIALCLDAGLPLHQSQDMVLTRYVKFFEVEVSEQTKSEIAELVHFSHFSGAPIAKLFRNRAEESRRQATHAQNEILERVSIRLLAPLAIFVLPAFVLITVLPISISLITN